MRTGPSERYNPDNAKQDRAGGRKASPPWRRLLPVGKALPSAKAIAVLNTLACSPDAVQKKPGTGSQMTNLLPELNLFRGRFLRAPGLVLPGGMQSSDGAQASQRLQKRKTM